MTNAEALFAASTLLLAIVLILVIAVGIMIFVEVRARLRLLESMAHEQISCNRPHAHVSDQVDLADYGMTMNAYPPVRAPRAFEFNLQQDTFGIQPGATENQLGLRDRIERARELTR